MPTNEIDALESRIVLISPSLSYWRGNYQISPTSINIKGDDVNMDSVTSPRTKLMDCCELLKGEHKKFRSLDAERVQLVEAVSVKFKISGVRVVPVSAIPELLNRLIGPVDEHGFPTRNNRADPQSISFRLGEAADEFVAKYPQIMESLERYTPQTIWHQVKHKIPTQANMRRMFSFDCPAVRIASPSSASLSVAGVNMKNIDTIFQQAATRQVEDAVQQIVVEPRTELAETLSALQLLINRDGRVTTKSFAPVLAAKQKFGVFEFGTLRDQPELQSKLALLDRMMSSLIPSELTSAVSRQQGFDTLLTETIGLLNNEQQQQQVAVNFCRRIRSVG